MLPRCDSAIVSDLVSTKAAARQASQTADEKQLIPAGCLLLHENETRQS